MKRKNEKNTLFNKIPKAPKMIKPIRNIEQVFVHSIDYR